ncbi:MAG: hypothetical protein KA715_06795 [Xanthomonadaceae bacterium]|nr:hypothetical protein [Xanthomonadaceae bacterium]
MKKLSLLLLVLFSSAAHAQVFTLPQLTTIAQTDLIFKNLAANLIYRPVEGATPLNTSPKPFGIGFGVTAVVTDTSSLTSIIGSGTPTLPGATINIDLGLPMGFGVEFGFLPSITYSGTSFNNLGGDLRWNFSPLLGLLPVDLSARLLFSSSSIASTQLISGATVNINYAATQIGLMLTAGKKISIIEPYLSLGFTNNASSLSYSGIASLFGSTFGTGTRSVNGGGLGFLFNTGLSFDFTYVKLGFEYENIYGISSGAAKFGFKF